MTHPLPETTVGSLAQQLGVSTDRVMEACRARRILVWSAETPLNQQEAELVWNTIQPPPPPPAAGSFAAQPTAQAPPVTWTTPGGAPPQPPPPQPSPPNAPATAPWATGPTQYGAFPPAPAPPPNRTGWIIAGTCFAVLGFFVAAVLLIGTTADEPPSDSFSFGNDTPTLPPGTEVDDPEPAEVEAPVLSIPDYDRIGQTKGDPPQFENFEIGDCVTLPDTFLDAGATEIETIFPKATDCLGPHNAEVFQVGEFEAPSKSAAPLGNELFLAGGEACFDSFLEFIETGFDEHDFVVLVPLDLQWERLDQRRFTCFAYRLDGDTTEGSMRERAANG